MLEQTKWADMIVENSRQYLKTGNQVLDNVQRQTDKMIDISVNNMAVLQNEAKKNYENLMDNVKKSHSVFIETIEEGLSTFAKQFSEKKETIRTK